MTNSYGNGESPENQPTPHQEQPAAPTTTEAAYERVSAYGFARRYTEGKIVANIIGHQEEMGAYGSHLLAPRSVEAVRAAALRELPEGRFDVVVGFGVVEDLEHPEELVREARRVLKEGGVLLVSVVDKKQPEVANRYYRDRREGTDGGRRRAAGGGMMYVPEFRGLLERHFGHVRLYRQGAVAGGIVFPLSKELTGGAMMAVESVRLSSHSGPRLGMEVPTTRSVLAVCSDDAAALRGEEGEEQAYLLLDRDRRAFYECEERAEDVELLRAEIRRMQETEVQAFVEAIKVRQSLVRELLHSPFSYRNLIFEEIRYRQSIIRGNMRVIRQKGAKGSAKGAFRRISAFYRRLQGINRTSD